MIRTATSKPRNFVASRLADHECLKFIISDQVTAQLPILAKNTALLLTYIQRCQRQFMNTIEKFMFEERTLNRSSFYILKKHRMYHTLCRF